MHSAHALEKPQLLLKKSIHAFAVGSSYSRAEQEINCRMFEKLGLKSILDVQVSPMSNGNMSDQGLVPI